MAMIKRLNNKIKNLFGSDSKQVVNNEHNYDFPILVKFLSKLSEDILIEILVRVPADVLVLLRPMWQNLISSPSFIDLHLKRADSIHIVQSVYCDRDVYKNKTELSIVDCTRGKKCMDLVSHHITDQDDCTLWSSCGGLLAFWGLLKTYISIVNPITGENREIPTPTSYGYLCGFFFDRFQGRYKLLYVDRGHPKVINGDVYYTFGLSENVWRKIDMIKSRSDSRPNYKYPGVIVGDALYWIADSFYHCQCSKMVVVFEIETHELYSLPHPPVTRCDFGTHENFMKLIAKDGQLCFFHTIVEERVVDLWILEDYENWESWVKKFKVNLDHKMFRSMRSRDMSFYLKGLQIGSPQNRRNEILVTCKYCSYPEGLYLYNLETHRSSQLETTRSKSDMYECVMIPYTKTMLSPMFEVSSV